MPKVFDLKSFVEQSVKHKMPDSMIVLCLLTWVPDCIGKTKYDIEKIPYMTQVNLLLDEWFIEKEEGTNGKSQHSTLQN